VNDSIDSYYTDPDLGWINVGGLFIRQDHVSWMGGHPSDERVFFRRLKPASPAVFSDLLMGDIPDAEFSDLLALFVERTGGLRGPEIKLQNIAFAYDDPSESEVEAVLSKNLKVLWPALLKLHFTVQDVKLEIARRKVNAYLTIRELDL